MNPLQSRLAALRRRLRLVVLSRGMGSIIVLLLAGGLVAMALDWYLNLPGLVRAFLLVGILTGAGYVAFQFLVAPARHNPAAAQRDRIALRMAQDAALVKHQIGFCATHFQTKGGWNESASEPCRTVKS